MTLLTVHDRQQDLSVKFVNYVKKALGDSPLTDKKKEEIYLIGQEMGFCNDEIAILIEDVLPSK